MSDTTASVTDEQDTENTNQQPGQEEGQEPTSPQHNEEGDDRISQLNAEAAKWRTKFREQEKATAEFEKRQQEIEQQFESYKQNLAKVMGLAEEEDVEDLGKKYQEQAKAADERYNQLRQRVALTEAVQKAKADPDLTVPFIKGGEAFNALDPSADDYEAQVAELVAETVAATPKLRAQVAPASSGNAPTPSENSGSRKLTVEDLDNMSPEEIYEARKAGKLNHLF